MLALFSAYVQSHMVSLKSRMSNDRGATAVEYGLMVGLIAVAIIVTVGLLGGKLDDLFGYVEGELPVPPAAP